MNITTEIFRRVLLGSLVISAAVSFAADSGPVGVFDSGIGGLSVLEVLLTIDRFDNASGEERPDGRPDFAAEDFVYFGDQANMPYGRYAAAGKSDFLRELVVRDARFVLGGDGHEPAKIVVIACNTATAYGLEAATEAARPAGVRVIGVVNAGAEAALDALKDEREPYAIAVMATPGTIASGVYERTIRAAARARGQTACAEVVNRGGIGLAEAVENNEPGMRACARTNVVALVESYRARGGRAPIRAFILGCTHYPFVLDVIRSTLEELRRNPEYAALLAEKISFIDPAVNTAVGCYRALLEDGRLNGPHPRSKAKKVAAFLSVGKDGPLSDAVKYGRSVDDADYGTRIVPMTVENLPNGAPELIRTMMPVSARELGFSPERIFARETAGTCWQDGVFLGDGANGVVASAPMGLEWVLNRNTLFYSLTNEVSHVTHAEFMRLVKEKGYKDSWFMDPLEGRDDARLYNTISAAVLKLRFWGGIDWGAPSAPAVSERLSLDRGELVQRLRAGMMDISVTTVVPRGKDVVAIRIENRDLGRKHKPVFELVRPENELLGAPERTGRTNGVETLEQTLPGGVTYAVALAISEDQSEAFVAVRTSRETADPLAAAKTAALNARAEGFAAAQRANAAWWTDFWQKGGDATFTSAPDVDLAWHISLYTMAATYGKTPMPGLNGLSYGPLTAEDSGPGAQFYTHDQNVQIPMFVFNPVNRVDFVKPFAETYLEMLPKLRDWTRCLFDCEGTHLPLCLNQDGTERCCHVYRYTLDGAAYSGLVLATAWRYSRDTALLKSHLYPLLKEFAAFYLAFMEKDVSGTYHLTLPSIPPEIFFFTKDSTSILAMLKPCLETVVEASEILGVDAELRTKARDVLAHYPALVRHPEGGWWCGPEIPAEEAMFGGHLFYPFYPAEADLNREAAEGTLAYFWKHGADVSYLAKRPHAISEWAAYYAGVAELRLHGGERGWAAIRNFLSDYGKPNGLFSHNAVILEDPAEAEAALVQAKKPYWKWSRAGTAVTSNPRAKAIVPAVIEGSGAFVFLGAEALLQSWGGEIRLFPGVPKNFTGEFRNFLAQGGKRVSAKMVDGKVVWKEIR